MAKPEKRSIFMIRLASGDCEVLIEATAGGRVVQITVDGQPLLDDRDGPEPDPTSVNWGSFVMAPWAGRVDGGRFEFDDTAYQLGLNCIDGEGDDREHAIHGTVFGRPWIVDAVTDVSLTMQCSLAGSLGWSFGGRALQRIDLRERRVEFQLCVESAGETFPAEIGWHPWFCKPHRLSFEPTAMYERDSRGLPTGTIGSPTHSPWDDCFLNTKPVTLHYERSRAPAVRIESDCDHWVIYDEPATSTCVEPQSGPPDAFRLGPHVVTPETPLRRTMSISW
jgi:aldose 1-epimerase